MVVHHDIFGRLWLSNPKPLGVGVGDVHDIGSELVGFAVLFITAYKRRHEYSIFPHVSDISLAGRLYRRA